MSIKKCIITERRVIMYKNYLICYDISNTKKRNKIANLLESYGYRVNYSVFELDIKTHKLNTLLEELKKFMNGSDSIRVYSFSADTIAKSFELNSKLSNPFEKVNSYVE